MQQEILIGFAEGVASQPRALNKSIGHSIQWLDEHSDLFANRRIMFTGIGASYAALATPTWLMRQHGVTAWRTSGDDLPEGNTEVPADIVVAVSQSGRSPETVHAVEHLDRSKRIALVNRHPEQLTEACEQTWTLGDLTDSSMSSVAATATLAGLGLLADVVTDDRADIESWKQLPDLLSAQLADSGIEGVLDDFVQRYEVPRVLDLVARADMLSAAEQGALLLREGPKVPSMAMPTRNYLHGSTDCVGEVLHIIIGGEREALLADQLAGYDVPVLFLAADSSRPKNAKVLVAALQQTGVCEQTLLAVAAIQRLTVKLGDALGRDVDEGVLKRIDTKLPEREA